jgi:multimeric flavodoxin WrbA
MMILGIVGSPRKKGRTNQLVEAALRGAESTGAATRKVYLGDYDISPFTGSGGSTEAFQFCPVELSELCEEAGAIVLGAPVYWGDINGLTKDFMDTVRIRNASGKPALGIAIAGGSGKGLLSGVQTIYHFFFHKQMRGIDPTPVSRFNLQEALGQLEASGVRLAGAAEGAVPFAGQTGDERWPEVLAHYAPLDVLRCDPVDEFVMLARQLIAISEGSGVDRATAALDEALALIAEGRRREAAPHAVSAYQALYFPP